MKSNLLSYIVKEKDYVVLLAVGCLIIGFLSLPFLTYLLFQESGKCLANPLEFAKDKINQENVVCGCWIQGSYNPGLLNSTINFTIER